MSACHLNQTYPREEQKGGREGGKDTLQMPSATVGLTAYIDEAASSTRLHTPRDICMVARVPSTLFSK
jgi:hypothetical protein